MNSAIATVVVRHCIARQCAHRVINNCARRGRDVVDCGVDLLRGDSAQTLGIFIDILWRETALYEAEYLAGNAAGGGKSYEVGA